MLLDDAELLELLVLSHECRCPWWWWFTLLTLLCFTLGNGSGPLLSLAFASNGGAATPDEVAGVDGATDPVELVEPDDAVDSFRRSLWCDLLLPDPPLLPSFSGLSCSWLLLVLELLECWCALSEAVSVDDDDGVGWLMGLIVPQFVLPRGAVVIVVAECLALPDGAWALGAVATVVGSAGGVDEEEEEEEVDEFDTFGVVMVVVVAVVTGASLNAESLTDSFMLVWLLPLVLVRLLLLFVKLLLLLLQIFVLAFSVKLILLFKTLVFGLFARVAAWVPVATVSAELVEVLVLAAIVPVLVLPVTGADDVTVAGAKDVVLLDAVTAATEGIDGGWLGNGYWRPDFTDGLGLLYGCGLFIGEPDALQLPSRCKLGAGGV